MLLCFFVCSTCDVISKIGETLECKFGIFFQLISPFSCIQKIKNCIMNFLATQAKYLCNELRINFYMTPKHKTCKFDREKFCGELSAMTILRASLTKSITFTGCSHRYNGLILYFACITLCWELCPCTFIYMNIYTHVPHTRYIHNMHKPECHSLICSLNICVLAYIVVQW